MNHLTNKVMKKNKNSSILEKIEGLQARMEGITDRVTHEIMVRINSYDKIEKDLKALEDNERTAYLSKVKSELMERIVNEHQFGLSTNDEYFQIFAAKTKEILSLK